MANGRKAGRLLVVALAAAAMALVLPGTASAHGHGHGHGGHVVVGGFYGYGPYFGYGWGFGPFWGPYWWGPPGFYGNQVGVDMNAAMIAGMGGLDIDAKPNRAEVWVDGKYYGEARDLDGYPSYLWLKQGPHKIEVYKGGYAPFSEQIEVQQGMMRQLKVRLEKGESQPPGTKPGEKPAEKSPQAPKEQVLSNPFK
jgi:hypothetical protein